MKVLICGGRDFYDGRQLSYVLDELARCFAITLVIDGGARGADSLGHEWAATRGIPTSRYFADWNVHGRGAGPICNQRMLDEGKPDLVVAFPGGRGTADMMARSSAARIRVIDVGALQEVFPELKTALQ